MRKTLVVMGLILLVIGVSYFIPFWQVLQYARPEDRPFQALALGGFVVVIVMGIALTAMGLREKKAVQSVVQTPAPSYAPPEVPVSPAKFCSSCGASIAAHAKYCSMCGAAQG